MNSYQIKNKIIDSQIFQPEDKLTNLINSAVECELSEESLESVSAAGISQGDILTKLMEIMK